jgi:hypothetical protein
MAVAGVFIEQLSLRIRRDGMVANCKKTARKMPMLFARSSMQKMDS